MAEPVTTAGRGSALPPLRREAVRAVRRVIRDPKSTEDQVDDALEALLELARIED